MPTHPPAPARRASRLVAVLAALAVALGLGLSPTADQAAADPAVPQPVLDPAADPGIFREGHSYYAFMTGGRVKMATATHPQGPWTALPGNALTRWPDWTTKTLAAWAPDVDRTSAGYVLWFAAPAAGFGGQRCIGAAVSQSPTGPYEPSDTPLICPVNGGEDPVADRPNQTSGVIDPAPFVDTDGRRYLTYKTQKTPGTLRMVELTADGLHLAEGAVSAELFRHDDSIENPVMVKRGEQYVLLASANWYDQCRYATVWRRSTDLWSFADKPEHVLLDQGNTGLCGPGGADVVTEDGPDRMFLHGWVCPPDGEPCPYEGLVTDPQKRRVMYAAVLTWGEDGATPQVPTFLRPRG
ncbi:family 43 glycosylhydrolase [Auraticoccus sp. F435]|uniref:Family 43 glycosylhydrolase n=1 Tax=Auraticoccus cholistanensis TaxID=2656650 RepID=A0A6A9URY1_9ACTN|nr:glycoside hydrolase family 43 protein [Auraticoccus cholistanensis]MVA74475.1 family 43 glycosylhydrolase [Auraticoccus cholistanensis]